MLNIKTANFRQIIDITEQVGEQLEAGATLVHVFVKHTTCAVTTADLDPGMDQDMLEAFWEMIPKIGFSEHHNPAHAPSHIAASIIGPSVTVPVENGKLQLGTWQRVILVELDGPREREVIIIVQ